MSRSVCVRLRTGRNEAEQRRPQPQQVDRISQTYVSFLLFRFIKLDIGLVALGHIATSDISKGPKTLVQFHMVPRRYLRAFPFLNHVKLIYLRGDDFALLSCCVL